MTEHEIISRELDRQNSPRMPAPETVAERVRNGEPIFDALLTGDTVSQHDATASRLDQLLRRIDEVWSRYCRDKSDNVRSHADVVEHVAGLARLRTMLRLVDSACRELSVLDEIAMDGIEQGYIREY